MSEEPPLSRHQEIRREVQEIYDVLRRQEPDADWAELWTRALSLHAVRYEPDPPIEPEDEELRQ